MTKTVDVSLSFRFENYFDLGACVPNFKTKFTKFLEPNSVIAYPKAQPKHKLPMPPNPKKILVAISNNQ